ncbi:ATP-dependent RNA helicase vasa-like [Bradysia coprophila]|uniref:ATP-dependent RNA helicase vasa-like n=1 Tax=Bradysia coprophila TaxID=38358 RepID=UPI00187DC735|nr:ATP-dependent RNA helicase vasa-like [Bradysia coprophila]
MASTFDNTYGFGSSRASDLNSGGYQPRRSNWICSNSSCAATNFGNRDECFKCHEEKGDAVDAPADSNFKPRQRTEWICTDTSCATKNFGHRTECFKCYAAKGDAEDVAAEPYKPRASDWICTNSSCALKNFGNRFECFKCHEPKGDAQDAPEDYTPPARQKMEWYCTDSSCGARNFQSRTECFKCSEPKGDAQDVPADSSGGNKTRANDWICTNSSCGVKNFGSRNECFKCQEPKGDAQDAPEDSSGGNRPKDWICSSSSCGVKNFASRSECFKCSEPKGDAQDAPDSGTGGAQDDKPKESYIPTEANEDEIFTMNIAAGINFCKLQDIPVTVTGDNVPPPCRNFAEADLRPFVLENITRSGYTTPTPVQQNAIPIISSGRDLMACAQTGSGKTAAFLIPIINKLLTDERDMMPGSPHVLIVSPTRELVTQIYYEAKKFSAGSFLKVCQIYGGTVTSHQSSNLAHGCHILVATPGRLQHFLDSGYVDFKAIRFAVLDEADRMLDMGFVEAAEKIMGHPTMVPVGTRQTLMFSATFAEEVKTLAAKYLHDYLFLAIGVVGGASQDVEQIIHAVPKLEKREKLTEILDAEDPSGTIVFVATQRTADFLATLMSESKHPTTSIHGARLQSQREQALRDFKSNNMKILIATSVAARGLDIPNVSHVINYDLPKEIDDYVHRIGRTGRVGNKGKATSFYDEEQDASLVPDLIKVLEGAGQTVPDFLQGGGGGQTGGGNADDEEW